MESFAPYSVPTNNVQVLALPKTRRQSLQADARQLRVAVMAAPEIATPAPHTMTLSIRPKGSNKAGPSDPTRPKSNKISRNRDVRRKRRTMKDRLLELVDRLPMTDVTVEGLDKIEGNPKDHEAQIKPAQQKEREEYKRMITGWIGFSDEEIEELFP
ncbi:hypothetical protein VTJ04DRAFT_10438 [Mycothermus thermophilus]|uniref:uncharacterized protein n=1 Tax=Humicola insolens TaxID=85995 RepID=UPI0037438441